MTDLAPFLAADEVVDWLHPEVRALARDLTGRQGRPAEVAERCFTFVRDEIRHSWDARQGPVTCAASEVLRHRTGFCYAKSHLLAALLRANGLPAGLCYQRLAVGELGPPWCLHGLNAVLLPEHGWYRLDARGNKAGVEARFRPPVEQLAFVPRAPGEADLPELWPRPLPVVLEALRSHPNVEALAAGLPDVLLLGR
jgi:transglutaminase-like putative cysteine protease